MESVPYRCNVCVNLPGCGASGQIVFGEGRAPSCRHNEPPGKPCHDKPVKMERSRV